MNDQSNIAEFRAEFFNLVEDVQSILITSHKNPDDDSISSVLTIYSILNSKYPEKNLKIIYSSEFSNRWSYFENFGVIESRKDVRDELENFDLVICLDGSQYARFTSFPEDFEHFKGKTICIDHHSSPVDQFTLTYVEKTKTSTAEVLYDLFLSDKDKIEARLAECVLLGIIGDTGTFRFIRPDQVEVFDVIRRLVKEGNINIQDLKAQYEKISERVYALIQRFIDNSKIDHVEGWPRFMSSYISRDYFTSGKYTLVELSEAAHIFIQTFGQSIEGVNWSMVAYPTLDGFGKVSMRSLPKSVNVRMIGEQMGLGGGHDRAGGCTVKQENVEPAACLEIIKEWMNNNSPTLS